MSKYKNVKTTIGGIAFDSKKEGERYQELKLLEKVGIITDLVLQPEFILQEKFRYHGKIILPIKYKADFQYKEDGAIIVEDVKGYKTDVFLLKEKMFKHQNQDVIFRIT